MHVVKEYKTYLANSLIQISPVAAAAYQEIIEAIGHMIGQINNSKKHANSVTPIKAGLVNLLHDSYGWKKEKQLKSLSGDLEQRERKKGVGGGIDVYKEFVQGQFSFNVGLEFETGNVASVHRSLNKMALGVDSHELDLMVLVLPVYNLSYFLTDRSANYEEIEAYFKLYENRPFIAFGFEAEKYGPQFEIFEKGNDGNHKK